jgi:hypothetical protein
VILYRKHKRKQKEKLERGNKAKKSCFIFALKQNEKFEAIFQLKFEKKLSRKHAKNIVPLFSHVHAKTK